jgi:hypothetical protein
VDEYWHPGSLLLPVMFDLEEDGVPELLVGGISNPGHGLGRGALVALSVPFSRSPTANGSALAGFFGGREIRYALFSRPDVCQATGTLPFVGGLDIEGDRILAQVSCGAVTVFYYLDRFFRLQDMRLSDSYAAVHDGLFRQRLLTHAFSDTERECLAHVATFPGAVDGNGPSLLGLWRGCE